MERRPGWEGCEGLSSGKETMGSISSETGSPCPGSFPQLATLEMLAFLKLIFLLREGWAVAAALQETDCLGWTC
jgi:hypothetical protein